MHTHHCEVCKQPVAVCSDAGCQGDTGHYCSVHHPDPEHRVIDPPTVRMTVKIAPDEAK